jgi:hypothetical protein
MFIQRRSRVRRQAGRNSHSDDRMNLFPHTAHRDIDPAAPTAVRLPRWLPRLFFLASLVGLTVFGIYILLRATGQTPRNFGQWDALVSGKPMAGLADAFANIGIGIHYFMGAVLVLAWPILLSQRIRARHRTVHRWTGRVYVAAGLLAGAGGMAFILARHDGGASHVAFAIWGGVMMLSATMAFVHARARRIELHRAWAIRLFAMVLGSWLFDIEYRAWRDLAGGAGIGSGGSYGPFDYAILYLFFVPNLLVAEYFIRKGSGRAWLPRVLKWPSTVLLVLLCLAFAHAIFAVSATPTGKYGRHLLGLLP